MNNVIKRCYWWLMHRFHPKHRYNIIRTGLPAGYYDPDTQILYGVMNTFKSWYEGRTDSFFQRSIDWDTNPELKHVDSEWVKKNYPVKQELDIIYDWWVNRYLKMYELGNSYQELSDQDYQIMVKVLETLDMEATEMLIRLMKHRQYLWY